MEEFIQKTEGVEKMKRARTFAQKHRALGLGVLGWHTYLQSKNQPFNGIFANSMTKMMFGSIKGKAERASEKLAEIYGNCPVIEKYNEDNGTDIKRRHTALLAVAPTTSNATIAGGVSPGIEPLASNYFILGGAKGNFLIKNEFLERVLEEKYQKNDKETWSSIKSNSGSVQHLEWMDEGDKEVFLTFSEINQFELVRQAALRQNYIDQGQSLNVNIPPDTDPKVVSSLYLLGYELGIKSFYYQRSENILRKGLKTMEAEACEACSG